MRFATLPGDHRFFTVMSLVASVIIVAGFGGTYGARLAAGHTVPVVIHLHALAFSAWLVLFVTQAVLAARGRLALHRRLGWLATALAGTMLVLGVAAAVSAGRHGHRGLAGAEFESAGAFTLFSVLAVLAFFTLTAAALWFRAYPQAHKRLMLMSLLGALLPPGLSRLLSLMQCLEWLGGVATLFLLVGPAWDLATRQRIHVAYVWAAFPIAATFPPFVSWLAQTRWWLGVASEVLG
ncbi:MAG: hypothetical protein JNM17_23120 [Archangium sp.]|nr:hypothetical protein [Archangium sp.]